MGAIPQSTREGFYSMYCLCLEECRKHECGEGKDFMFVLGMIKDFLDPESTENMNINMAALGFMLTHIYRSTYGKNMKIYEG